MFTQIRSGIFLTLLFSAFLAFFISTVAARDVARINSIGTDGDEGIYKVSCTSGYDTSVSVFFKETPVRVCTFAYDGYGKEVCRTGWTVDEAAAWACKKYR